LQENQEVLEFAKFIQVWKLLFSFT